MPAKQIKNADVSESETPVKAKPKAKAKSQPKQNKADLVDITMDLTSLMTFAQDNYAASLKASAILSDGMRQMNDLVVEGVTSAIEDSTSASKALMECHSLPDLFELQNSFARSVVETALVESKKISEASLKTAEDAAEPLAERFAQAVEHFGLPDAA